MLEKAALTPLCARWERQRANQKVETFVTSRVVCSILLLLLWASCGFLAHDHRASERVSRYSEL